MPRTPRLMAVTLAASIALTACATNVANDPSLSPAQNQLRQANAHFSTTVGEGAVAGAALGGLAGLAFGGRNRGQAALIGAAAGGVLGGGAGYLVARNNLSRASTEAQFTDAIDKASADADAYRNSAVASRQIADQANADAQRLRAQYQARQITREQYRAGLAKYRADTEIMRSQAAEAHKAAAAMQQDSRVASGPNRTRLAGLSTDVETAGRQQEETAARMSRLLAGADS